MKAAPRSNAYRDAWNGDLRAARVGDTVRVAGWVHNRRHHGGLIFVDLRDRSGLVQLVLHPDTADAFALAERLRSEHVVSALGKVVAREEGQVNPNIPTGEIELQVSELTTLAESETPPFPLDGDAGVDELTRLRHRYLDLRRERMQRNLALRHEVVATIRQALSDEDFLEIETPILTRSTPEGARDFLVPNRRDPGTWYALPQSPQLFKQLLMISGYERYFQIARCFRDEDLRADRQPEFTQLDVEMAFVEEDDVIDVHERVMAKVFEVAGMDVGGPPPYRRMGYDEALLRYGVDRPDTRFGLQVEDISSHLAGSDFKVFSSVLGADGVVRMINAGAIEAPRKILDDLTEFAKQHGAGGLVWAFVEEGGTWRCPIAKFLTSDELANITQAMDAKPGDLLLAVADTAPTAAKVLGALRMELARRYDLIPAGRHEILWIVDFPMFERNEDEDRWDALHHPFTAPLGSFDDPGSLRSRAYDLVLDGWELGGGSIRINTPEVQGQVFAALGMDAEEAEERFGFLLEALRFGAPPHGGIAFGIDRIVALLAGADSIREVMAFPKTASGADALTGAPSPVDERQIRELGLKLLAPRSS